MKIGFSKSILEKYLLFEINKRLIQLGKMLIFIIFNPVSLVQRSRPHSISVLFSG